MDTLVDEAQLEPGAVSGRSRQRSTGIRPRRKFPLAGSSGLTLDPDIADALIGRSENHRTLARSRKIERGQVADGFVDALFTTTQASTAPICAAPIWSTEVWASRTSSPDRRRASWFDNYLTTSAVSDRRFRSSGEMPRVLRLCAAPSARLNVSALANDLSVSTTAGYGPAGSGVPYPPGAGWSTNLNS